jgi:CheY-like chemotaxis protein
MPAVHRVAFLGLRDFEREAIAACLRLATGRTPRYELAALMDEATLLVADAEHAPSVQVVVATEMLARTLFIGAAAPAGAVACMARPIDPQHLLRELDALVAGPDSASAAERPAAVAAPARPAQAPPVDLLLDLGPPARQQTPAPPGASVPGQARVAAPAPEATAPTALLVDDSEIALRFLESRLQRWGLVMDRALSSGRAIELMSERSYDFVFLDVELGKQSDLDGLALCQHIKRQQAQRVVRSAVFIVSAHASQMDRVRGGLAGCDAYLGKPLDEVELQRLLLRHGLKPRAQAAPDGAPAA